MAAGRWRIKALAALAGVLTALLVASLPSAAPASAPARPAHLKVGVEVLRFAASGRSLRATGLVTATLTDGTGQVRSVHSTVALSAAAGGGCRVLHLFLNELNLQLLGLNAHLEKVQLDITGNANGGVLGSLFCRLARAKVASARAAEARALTAGIRRKGHALGFTAQLNPALASTAAAGTTCPVLDLVVGPLNLQLLGLVVDLNRVHLAITATRGAGKLGDTFCQLADNSTTSTTTTT
jgi:hypothetical protein